MTGGSNYTPNFFEHTSSYDHAIPKFAFSDFCVFATVLTALFVQQLLSFSLAFKTSITESPISTEGICSSLVGSSQQVKTLKYIRSCQPDSQSTQYFARAVECAEVSPRSKGPKKNCQEQYVSNQKKTNYSGLEIADGVARV